MLLIFTVCIYINRREETEEKNNTKKKMRVPVYVMCAALIVAVKTDKSSLFTGNEPPETELGQRDDPIGLELLLPRLLYAKYRQRLLESSNNNNNRQWIPFNPYPYSNVESNDVGDQVMFF